MYDSNHRVMKNSQVVHSEMEQDPMVISAHSPTPAHPHDVTLPAFCLQKTSQNKFN